MTEKVEPPYCDGFNHRWSYSRPIRCAGCGQRFSDLEALERQTALRKLGYTELRNIA